MKAGVCGKMRRCGRGSGVVCSWDGVAVFEGEEEREEYVRQSARSVELSTLQMHAFETRYLEKRQE